MPDTIPPKWKIEKSVSLGDLITVALVFVSAAMYIGKNETDKVQIAARIEAEAKTFQTYIQTQNNVDMKQDLQREDLKRDLLTRINAMDTKLDNITFYLLKGKTP